MARRARAVSAETLVPETQVSASSTRHPASLMSLESFHDKQMQLAGITPVMLQKAVTRINDALDADTDAGKPSHSLRLQAARELLQIAGLYGQGGGSRGTGEPVHVTVNVASFAKPK